MYAEDREINQRIAALRASGNYESYLAVASRIYDLFFDECEDAEMYGGIICEEERLKKRIIIELMNEFGI